eukprot:scaffold2922_cov278-Ochromonas_danica.AAC.4
MNRSNDMNPKLPQEDEAKQVSTAAMLMAIVGVGYLFPFSALTQPVDYWTHEFPDFNIEFPLTTLYMWVNLLFLGFLVFLGRQPSYHFRIIGGFLGQTLVLLLVPSLYFLHLSENHYYLAVMLATAFAATVTALVDSVAIGFAAHYPSRVQEGLQLGIGLSTLLGSIYRILTKAFFAADQVVLSSLLYFYVGAVTLVGCIFVFYHLLALPISKRHFSHLDHHHEEQSLVVVGAGGGGGGVASYGSLDEESTAFLADDDAEDVAAAGVSSAATSPSAKAITSLPPSDAPLDQWTLLGKVGYHEFLVVLLFASTLLLWPPLLTEIPCYSHLPALEEGRWWSLILLLLFAVMDCLGRWWTSHRMGLTKDNIDRWVYLRLLLIPCLIGSSKGMSFFRNDLLSLLLVSLLGWSNGYIGSLVVMMINEMVEVKDKGRVGGLTGFFLNFGLVIGSTFALVLKAWLDSW